MTIVTHDLIQLLVNRRFFYTDQSLFFFSANLSIVSFQSQEYRFPLATRTPSPTTHTHPPHPRPVASKLTMKIFAQYLIQLFLKMSILKQISHRHFSQQINYDFSHKNIFSRLKPQPQTLSQIKFVRLRWRPSKRIYDEAFHSSEFSKYSSIISQIIILKTREQLKSII